MTREDFNEAVIASYERFKDLVLTHFTQKEIFERAYSIAKITAIKDFLLNENDAFMSFLYAYANTILTDLDNFEDDYDRPMWGTMEDMTAVVNDFIAEKEGE